MAADDHHHLPRETQITVNSPTPNNPPLNMDPPPLPSSTVVKSLTKKWVAWLTPVFVVANVVMFVITMYVNNCPKNSFSCVADFLGRFSFQPFKENPLLGPSSTTLQKMGALDVGKVVDGHQGWRLITCNWLHAGFFHLLSNMLGLLVIGIRLEQEFGFSMYISISILFAFSAFIHVQLPYILVISFLVRIGLLYIVSGFGGSILSALFFQTNISVGASGALFGLLGGMLSELIANWTIYSNKIAALVTLVVIVVINLALGILPHVDNFAHIGGFLTGFLIGFVLLIRPQFAWVNQRFGPLRYSSISARHKFKSYQYILWIVSLILLIVGLTMGLILLLRGVNANDHCSWCHYLSCVPTSKWSCNTDPAYCLTDQSGTQVNVTCVDNGKNALYILANATSSQIQSICTDLCG